MVTIKTKREIVDYFRGKISTDVAWTLRALCKLYTLQTSNEQSSAETQCNNGVGFTPCDALF